MTTASSASQETSSPGLDAWATPFYVTGGSLPDDAPSYVVRQADNDLLDALRSRQFCYVLDSRQVGKSSLMVRAAARLRSEGFLVVVLDLSAFGQNISPEQWYYGMLFGIADQLHLEDELTTFWQQHASLGLVQRWMTAIRQVVLAKYTDPLVLFLDEIDAVKSLPFSVDEFFAAIRECYNRRTQDRELERLTFCLLGVATPSGLIQNPHTTPFNIGRRIVLEDFREAEAEPLARGLKGGNGNGIEPLQRILYWTGGHPYLTQRLCRAVAEAGNVTTAAGVDRICSALFLSRQARDTDDNLTFVRKRMLGEGEDAADVASILHLFLRVRVEHRKVANDPTDPLINTLLLSGVVRVTSYATESVLTIRNRIYERVFDRRWIRANMPDAELRRQRAALRRGYTRASLVWLTVGACLALALWQGSLARQRGAAADLYKKEAAQKKQENVAIKTENGRLSKEGKRLQFEADKARQAKQQAEAGARAANALLKTTTEAVRLALGKEKAATGREREAARREKDAKRQAVRIQQYSTEIRDGSLAVALAKQPGREVEALRYGVRAVASALADHRTPPDFAVQGLVDAVTAGHILRLRLVHPFGLCTASFSHDRSRIVTAGKDRLAYVWDANTGKRLQTLAAKAGNDPKQNVNYAHFTSDDKWIITASDEGKIRIWDATNRASHQEKPLMELENGHVTVGTAAIAHKMENTRKLLVSTGPDNTALIWNLDTRTSIPLKGHTKYLWSVSFSHKDDKVVTASEDGTVKVWDVGTGHLLQTYTGHQRPVLSAIFDRWGTLVISAGEDRSVQSWRWDGTYPHRTYIGHYDWVWSVSNSLDAFLLATASKDRTVKIWSLNIGQNPLFVLATHTKSVLDAEFSMDHSRDPRQLVTASDDGTAEVWRFTTPMFVGSGDACFHAEFSPDGNHVAIASADGEARLWDVHTNADLTMLSGHRGAVMHAAFSRDGSRVATAGKDGAVRLWPADYGRGRLEEGDSRLLAGHGGTVYWVDWSPDGKQVVSAGADKTVRVWDTQTKQCVWKRELRDQVVSSVFSHDGRRILTACKDGTVCLWDLQSGSATRYAPTLRMDSESRTGNHFPWSAVLSPDEQHVLAASADGYTYLWNTKSRDLEATLPGRHDDVLSARFSPDGTRIVTANVDNTVCLWDVRDALQRSRMHWNVTPMITIRSHVDKVFDAEFSPDGRQIVTASQDGTVRVYPATLEGFVKSARDILHCLPESAKGAQ